MTCRHMPGDPNCSATKYFKPQSTQATPDNTKFEILEVEDMAPYLVLKVKYDSCEDCSYEGTKVLVYRAALKDVFKWKTIDPHFSDKAVGAKCAPSPIARFPASDNGWRLATNFVKYLINHGEGPPKRT